MPKLTHNEITLELPKSQFFEDMFGVDHPGYLPYWLAYMSPKERQAYLLATKFEYMDIVDEMYNESFNWQEWMPYPY
jgi:hypothetical protein